MNPQEVKSGTAEHQNISRDVTERTSFFATIIAVANDREICGQLGAQATRTEAGPLSASQVHTFSLASRRTEASRKRSRQ
jgi:hypothetical protein